MLDPRDSLGEADNQSAGLSEIAGRAGRATSLVYPRLWTYAYQNRSFQSCFRPVCQPGIRRETSSRITIRAHRAKATADVCGDNGAASLFDVFEGRAHLLYNAERFVADDLAHKTTHAAFVKSGGRCHRSPSRPA